MLFNSFGFLVFFPVVVGLYFLTPQRARWAWLLAASYFFYMCWNPVYVLLIVGSTLVDYLAALKMGACTTRRNRRPWLVVSLAANLGLLFVFKYFNFFNSSLSDLFARWNLTYPVPTLHILLPVGISFYTFQTLSYAIDVYRGEREPEHHLGIFALYVAFFPQLVAGPIERSTRLLPQFRARHDFDYDRVTSGMRRMLWGFFKKMVIADRLASYVNTVYNQPETYHGWPVWLATFFFAFQIYCDFSGYSDIAIGAARVMGFKLMENFRHPYQSKTIGEFWKRWHISLSTWFRDYLYIPLGGNRVRLHRWMLNIIAVFVISGLWHGANWTFVVWGALHGTYFLVGWLLSQGRVAQWGARLLQKHPLKTRSLQVTGIFLLVCFAWIFFRANSLTDAGTLIGQLFDFSGQSLRNPGIVLPAVGLSSLILSMIGIGVLQIVETIEPRISPRWRWQQFPQWIRWSCYHALILSILFCGVFSRQQFIYFQF